MTLADAAGGRRRRPGRRPRLLPLAPFLTLALMAAPVAAGMLGVLAPAFGWLPALGERTPGLHVWRALLDWPGLGAAVWLSVAPGLAATAISLALAFCICAAWRGARGFRLIERALAPLLSVPHAAAAFGLAFLIAPSGWAARALSPWATGWEAPPDVAIPQDALGLSLVAGLVLKETPFLLLMILAALPQTDEARAGLAARAMGYGGAVGWLKTTAPRVYPQIRLAVYAVLAYGMSNVDMATILGPTTPPSLSAQTVLWARDPATGTRMLAAAAGALQTALILGALALWRLGELAAGRAFVRWTERGGRGRAAQGPLRACAGAAAAALSGAAALGLAGLAVWSFAGLWTWPNALPQGFSLRSWAVAAPGLLDAAAQTAAIGAAATLAAGALVVGCLEAEHRHGLRPGARALWLLYLPLIAPQAAFVFGLQTLALSVGVDGGAVAVAAAHVVFVLPYVFLAFADAFRAWDARLDLAARSLGAGPDRVLWAVRLPMLLRAGLTALAVGFAVSAGQYLPTLLIGGGEVATLTTEAVALAAGGDRRQIGVWALAQAAAPLAGFALALAVPALLRRR